MFQGFIWYVHVTKGVLNKITVVCRSPKQIVYYIVTSPHISSDSGSKFITNSVHPHGALTISIPIILLIVCPFAHLGLAFILKFWPLPETTRDNFFARSSSFLGTSLILRPKRDTSLTVPEKTLQPSEISTSKLFTAILWCRRFSILPAFSEITLDWTSKKQKTAHAKKQSDTINCIYFQGKSKEGDEVSDR